MTGESERIERLAMNAQPMPEDVGFSDKLLYLGLRSLYDLYRRGGISREDACRLYVRPDRRGKV